MLFPFMPVHPAMDGCHGISDKKTAVLNLQNTVSSRDDGMKVLRGATLFQWNYTLGKYQSILLSVTRKQRHRLLKRLVRPAPHKPIHIYRPYRAHTDAPLSETPS